MNRTFAEQLAWDMYHAEMGNPHPTGNWWDRMAPVIQKALDERPQGARAYTVAEIDRMRTTVKIQVSLERFVVGPNFERDVEERLRTYMLAGIAPNELEAATEVSDRVPAEPKVPQGR